MYIFAMAVHGLKLLIYYGLSQLDFQGKNLTTRELFEAAKLMEEGDKQERREQIKIDGRPDAKNLRERFERGISAIENEEDENGEPRQVDDVFRNAGMSSCEMYSLDIFWDIVGWTITPKNSADV